MSIGRRQTKAAQHLAEMHAHFPDVNMTITLEEQMALYPAAIVYMRRHFTPWQQERALYNMLFSLRDAIGVEVMEKKLEVVYALLNLGHLADDARAALHMQASQLCRPTGPHQALGSHEDHWRTAGRLASEGRFDELEQRFGF